MTVLVLASMEATTAPTFRKHDQQQRLHQSALQVQRGLGAIGPRAIMPMRWRAGFVDCGSHSYNSLRNLEQDGTQTTKSLVAWYTDGRRETSERVDSTSFGSSVSRLVEECYVKWDWCWAPTVRLKGASRQYLLSQSFCLVIFKLPFLVISKSSPVSKSAPWNESSLALRNK